jgi:hypothetical protein
MDLHNQTAASNRCTSHHSSSSQSAQRCRPHGTWKRGPLLRVYTNRYATALHQHRVDRTAMNSANIGVPCAADVHDRFWGDLGPARRNAKPGAVCWESNLTHPFLRQRTPTAQHCNVEGGTARCTNHDASTIAMQGTLHKGGKRLPRHHPSGGQPSESPSEWLASQLYGATASDGRAHQVAIRLMSYAPLGQLVCGKPINKRPPTLRNMSLLTTAP